MKRVSASFLPPLALDSNRNIPVYRQLYEWFRRAILAGQLRPGQRVPSTRSLAAELKVSRIPVSRAYEQLHAKGFRDVCWGRHVCVKVDPGRRFKADPRQNAGHGTAGV